MNQTQSGADGGNGSSQTFSLGSTQGYKLNSSLVVIAMCTVMLGLGSIATCLGSGSAYAMLNLFLQLCLMSDLCVKAYRKMTKYRTDAHQLPMSKTVRTKLHRFRVDMRRH